jgi:3-hydroxy-9,10-secoandrosta-1,3,5(10)-triene-9,17-dione monooxygenase reductase component
MPSSRVDTVGDDIEAEFRRVLGHFPTGVVAVTAYDDEPVGVAIGSFSSISLQPALVGFFIDRDSTTFPRIQRAGSFAVNVLAHDQSQVCALFGTKSADRFAEVSWTAGRAGAPLLDEALAWIECDIADMTTIGDHHLVIGAVRSLSAADGRAPLIFYGGGFHGLASARH